MTALHNTGFKIAGGFENQDYNEIIRNIPGHRFLTLVAR